MAADDIPAAILADGGDYLHRLAASPGGDYATPVPGLEHWAWVDAEVRLALVTGLNSAGTLDPRIDDVIAAASRWPARRQEDLFLRAAEQFAAQHAAAPCALTPLPPTAHAPTEPNAFGNTPAPDMRRPIYGCPHGLERCPHLWT
ncbi:hypothetical protein [Streptomyces sp. NPDC019890]|uniref:hypothetical protein n=1 Tax=Streptomyces sp. NPDC019890 TaxID=3365064 RepID=UPI00384B9735